MKSRYKYVKYMPTSYVNTKAGLKRWEELPWIAQVSLHHPIFGTQRLGASKRFATEREAAIHVDKVFLEHGRAPVNILKPKS